MPPTRSPRRGRGDPVGEQLATKADIADLKADIKVLKAVFGPIVIGLLLSLTGMVFKLAFFP